MKWLTKNSTPVTENHEDATHGRRMTITDPRVSGGGRGHGVYTPAECRERHTGKKHQRSLKTGSANRGSWKAASYFDPQNRYQRGKFA